MGNQQLLKSSSLVTDFTSHELRDLVTDMRDTMKAEGGVGIAAPQIGCNLRVIIFGFDSSERYPNEEPIPFTVLINPTIKAVTNEMEEGWEGCLSVPGLRGLVPRFKKIQYNGFDLQGNPISRKAAGFHARVVQHECDHIDGILYPARIENMQMFGFEDELAKVIWNSRNKSE